MQPSPSQVWMIHALTGINGIKGQLALEEDRLAFHPVKGERGAEYFSVSKIARARRLRGSPVLEVHLSDPAGGRVVGFYFVRPPSLEAPEGTRFSFKRKARLKAVAELYRGNAAKRQEVAAWVDAINAAKGRAT